MAKLGLGISKSVAAYARGQKKRGVKTRGSDFDAKVVAPTIVVILTRDTISPEKIGSVVEQQRLSGWIYLIMTISKRYSCCLTDEVEIKPI